MVLHVCCVDQIAQRVLRWAGIGNVDLATDGYEAFEAFQKQSYDLVLMDCQVQQLTIAPGFILHLLFLRVAVHAAVGLGLRGCVVWMFAVGVCLFALCAPAPADCHVLAVCRCQTATAFKRRN